MARFIPSVYRKKCLRDDDHKDELSPRPDPYNVRGLKGSWTRKETKRAVAVRWQTGRILGD